MQILQALRCGRAHYYYYADGKIFRKFRITATWEGGKVYGFLLGFRTVNFVLSSHAAAKRKQNFVLKFGLGIRMGY